MSTGAHVRPEPLEAVDRRVSDRRLETRRIDDRGAADALMLEAIRVAWDQEIDGRHPVPWEQAVRICRNFAAHFIARGGRL
jgi:hypothetical protein